MEWRDPCNVVEALFQSLIMTRTWARDQNRFDLQAFFAESAGPAPVSEMLALLFSAYLGSRERTSR
jgi:hypothetical protein